MRSLPRNARSWPASARAQTALRRSALGSTRVLGQVALAPLDVLHPKRKDEAERFHEDAHAHLRRPEPSFLERDRDLDYAGADQSGSEGRLDLEGVAAGVQSIEIDLA